VQFPESQIRWAAASVAGVFSEWAIEAHGFSTYINVHTGAQWVIFAKPKTGDQLVLADISLYHNLLEASEPSLKPWDIDAVLLEEGHLM
jgi:hypothetical protein